MTITRIGSTDKYAANWAQAFGEKKKAKSGTGVQATEVKGKKAGKNRSTGKKTKTKKK